MSKLHGAIEGKNSKIKCPANSGFSFSVVLQGEADDHYRFLFADFYLVVVDSKAMELYSDHRIRVGCRNKINQKYQKISVCHEAIS